MEKFSAFYLLIIITTLHVEATYLDIQSDDISKSRILFSSVRNINIKSILKKLFFIYSGHKRFLFNFE